MRDSITLIEYYSILSDYFYFGCFEKGERFPMKSTVSRKKGNEIYHDHDQSAFDFSRFIHKLLHFAESMNEFRRKTNKGAKNDFFHNQYNSILQLRIKF